MSPIIHYGLGWLCSARLTEKKHRAVVALAAVLPDVDGVGLLISEDLYVAWHHRLAHGALWAVVTAVTALLLTRNARVTLLAVVSFHTHILADLAGSGPDWPIFYTWPWTEVAWLPSWQWDLASWQNSLFGLATVLVCLGMALPLGRTPLELLSARGDGAVVRTLRARFG